MDNTGFNPCYSGNGFGRQHGLLAFLWLQVVSILVIVEMGLVGDAVEPIVTEILSFNPCYSGNGFGRGAALGHQY